MMFEELKDIDYKRIGKITDMIIIYLVSQAYFCNEGIYLI